MKLEEYIARSKANEEWVPGWDSIDASFDSLYPHQKPQHFATLMHARARLGGNEYLDGYSIYESPHGYKHLVTYGMSELYFNEKAFGGEWSKWGYEMTFKLREEKVDACKWAINMLGNLARYTFTSERFFEPQQYVGGDGTSINQDKPELRITALMIIRDTELAEKNTVHGHLDFLQLVRITTNEVKMLVDDSSKIPELARRLQEDYPYLETDIYRTKEYLF